jgi:hypothetical protein
VRRLVRTRKSASVEEASSATMLMTMVEGRRRRRGRWGREGEVVEGEAIRVMGNLATEKKDFLLFIVVSKSEN